MAPATRPPPPQGNPPAYAFVTRIYRRSLRPVVICCGVVACIWTLVWAVGAFQDLGGDKENLPRFIQFDITLGAMYSVIALIEVYGVASALSSRLVLVRIYTWLSIIAALTVTAAELMRTVLHFVFKDELISECTRESSGKTIRAGSGFWGATTTKALNEQDANDWCSRTWSQTTFADIAWLVVATIFGWLFSSIAFSYYHQLLDPTSVISRFSPSSREQYGMNPYPTSTPYAPGPYSNGNPFYGYSSEQPEYVPPYEASKLPGYGSEVTLTGTVAEKRVADEDSSVEGHSTSDLNHTSTTKPPSGPTV